MLSARIGRAWRRLAGGDPFGPAAYRRWIAQCERRDAPAPSSGPTFGIVTGDPRTLASLDRQSYTHWQAADSISGTAGEYLIVPCPGDELAPHTLQWFAQAAQAGADLIYCDEDRLDERGLRADPWFKPDWSPDLLADRDYIGAAMAFRRELGCGDARGLCAAARKIAHVPQVLYHRRGTAREDTRRVRYTIPQGWKVDIIVPSRNAAVLARCLESVASLTRYGDYGFTVIDNSAGEDVAAVARRFNARLVDWRGRPFNYAAMNNEAAAGSHGPALLFLNDDTSVIEPEWLGAMAEHAACPEVGAVGARLLYPDGRIQHAGVAIGIYGVCGHVFKGWPGDRPTYQRLGETVRNVSAVTGACLMVPADVFRQAGGFDERLFPVAYNDIDLCLRIGETGRRVIYTPHAVLRHHEAYSKPWRRRRPEPAEVRAFQDRWRKYIEHDPFYNPNLTRDDERAGLRLASEPRM